MMIFLCFISLYNFRKLYLKTFDLKSSELFLIVLLYFKNCEVQRRKNCKLDILKICFSMNML